MRFLFLFALSLPLLAQEPKSIADQLAAKDAEIASLKNELASVKSGADLKLSILSQTVSNCLQGIDRLTTPQQAAPKPPARPGRGPQEKPDK